MIIHAANHKADESISNMTRPDITLWLSSVFSLSSVGLKCYLRESCHVTCYPTQNVSSHTTVMFDLAQITFGGLLQPTAITLVAAERTAKSTTPRIEHRFRHFFSFLVSKCCRIAVCKPSVHAANPLMSPVVRLQWNPTVANYGVISHFITSKITVGKACDLSRDQNIKIQCSQPGSYCTVRCLENNHRSEHYLKSV